MGVVQSHEPQGPKRGSASDLITRAIYEHGPKTEDELISITGQMTAKRSTYRATLKRGLDSGWLDESEGKYSLTPWMAKRISPIAEEPVKAVKAEIVPAPYRPPFRPYQPKQHHRADDMRRVSFVTGCSDAPSSVWG
jgi:hypothetical protein